MSSNTVREIKLPSRLNKQPLIDAIFEMRFSAQRALSLLFPGVLCSLLGLGSKDISRLPGADIPEQIKNLNPDLAYLPSIQIDWGKFLIVISDKSIGLLCKMPYPGWGEFKNAILELTQKINESPFCSEISSMDRFSMKYVDLLESTTVQEQAAMINMEIKIGDGFCEFGSGNFQTKFESIKDGFTNVLQIVSSANVVKDGIQKSGIVIDNDTIRLISGTPIKEGLEQIPYSLDEMHLVNKKFFFYSITEETINNLEPVYE